MKALLFLLVMVLGSQLVAAQCITYTYDNLGNRVARAGNCGGNACNFTVSSSNPSITTSPNGSITLTASCTGTDCAGVNYQWTGNGLNQSGQNITINAPSNAGTYTYTVTASKSNCSNVTANVVVTVEGGGNGGCGSGTGLTANYFNGQDLQGSPIASLTQSTIDMSGDQTQNLPGLNIQASNISARWEGQVEAPVSGSYTFNMRTDDGTRVWFNNNQVVNDYGSYPPTDHNFTVTLNAGQKYDIKIEWKQGDGGYEAKFFWTYPGQSTQIVPACRLYPSSGGCTPPGAPSLSANPSTINSGQVTTLSASNCSGTVNWSTGATGTSINVSPTQTTTYTATCSANGCTSSNGSVTVTVNGGGSGGSGCALNKVRLVFRNDCCLHRLNGAKIQGSNDGSNWNDLYTINVNADGGWQEFTFGNTTSYSSVRFQASSQGLGELVELEFYNNNTKLTGTAFATGGTWENNSSQYGYQNAFDGNAGGNFWQGSAAGTGNTIGLNNISGCGGGCTPPNAPSLSANPSTINSGQSTTLSASNCSGTVNWSTGATGTSINVSPTQTTTYTATCSANGCTSSNGSVTVNVNGGGGGCGSGTGLTANYFSGHELQGSPIATLTQSTIDMSGDESQNLPILNIQAANISARWEGQVEAPVSGSYTFNIRTDDGVRMWFNNNQVVDDWGYYGATDHNFTVTLNAGQKYDIKIEWKQGGGGYEAKFFWTYPGQSTQIVPSCRLYPSSGGCTPPGAPSLSANPSTINSGQVATLSASNCSGTVNWSTGATGTSISVSPTQTTTYTATCSANGCTSSNGSVTVTVNGGGGSGCALNKVRLVFRNDCCLHRLNGAKIQGSNDGSNWNDLYTINVNADGGWQEFTFGNTTSYSSVRFQASSQGLGELVELEFYNNNTKLTGTAFATGGTWENNTSQYGYQNAFDGNAGGNFWQGSAAGTGNTIGLNSVSGCSSSRMGVVGEKENLFVNAEESIQLYPNPSTGQVTVRYYLAKGQQASLDFVNVAGVVVTAKNLIGEGGWQEDKTDLSKVPSGTYTLRWQSESQQVTKKLLIVK